MKFFLFLFLCLIPGFLPGQLDVEDLRIHGLEPIVGDPTGIVLLKTDPSAATGAQLSYIIGIITISSGAPTGETDTFPPFYYDSVAGAFYVHDGTTWQSIGAVAGGDLGSNLSSSTDDILSNNGTILLGGAGGANNETLDLDFETTANAVGISSTTGVTSVNWGTIDFDIDQLSTDVLVFEGATEDAFETTLDVVDPTQDNTATLPDASGTVALTNTIPVTFPLTIDAVADGMDYAVGFVHAAFTISEIRAVHVGTLATPDIDIDIRHSTDRSAAGNQVETTAMTITSSTTGDSFTAGFEDATVPANSWIWVETSSVSGTTDNLELIVRGTYD